MEEIERPLTIGLIITKKNGEPYLELRTGTKDLELIKEVIKKGLYDEPIIIYPKFTNKIMSINNMIEKGLLYKNEEGQLAFTI